jgi:MFS family permease
MKKIGPYKCLLWCVCNVFIGQTIEFIGAAGNNYVLMIIGRLVFATGSETLFVVQSFFVEKWFRD